MTRFITVLSGKGGVGKTTVAVNLGAALRRFGKDVIILDANLTTPDIGLYFGISNFPSTLTHFLKGEKEITESIYLHPRGFKVIPAGIDNSELKYLDMDMKKVIDKLKGLGEVVIIDCPAGLGKDVQSLLKLSDEVLIVTNPDLMSVTNALKAARLAEENEATVIGVVLNKVKKNAEMDTPSIESFLGETIISEIPEDDAVAKARINKIPLIFSDPGADAAVNFKKLAAKLIGETYETKLKRGWFK